MKTTVEIPDALFRRAKARAAEQGRTLRELVTEALQAHLAAGASPGREPAWMQGFGELASLHAETRRIQSRIDRDLRRLEDEDRR